MSDTQHEIETLRARWAAAEEAKVQDRIDHERSMYRRLRNALLQNKKPFLPPCTCEEYLTRALEMRNPDCPHFRDSLYWWLIKQGF